MGFVLALYRHLKGTGVYDEMMRYPIRAARLQGEEPVSLMLTSVF